jgi:hypothetical protein
LTSIVIIGLGVLAYIAYVLTPTGAPILANDSASYINFSIDRPIGYPFLLYLVKLIFGGYERAIDLHLFVYFFFVVFLCLIFTAEFKSLLLAIGLEFLLVVNPGPVRLADTIGSDSLAASLGIGYVGCMLLFSGHRGYKSFLALVAITTALALIRPINLLLFLPVLLAAFLFGGGLQGLRRWPAVFVTALGLIISTSATPAAFYFIHGSTETSSPLIRGLFGKIFFRPDVTSTTWNCPDEDFVKQTLAPVRDYIDRAPREFQPILELRYWSYLRFNVIIPTLMARHRFADESQTNEILKCYAWNYFTREPISLGTRIGTEYFRFMTNSTFLNPDTRQRYHDYIQKNPPNVPVAEGPVNLGVEPFSFFVPRAYPRTLSLGLSAFYFLSLLLFAVAVMHTAGWLFRGRTRPEIWLLIGLLGLGVQGKLWAYATIEAAQPRFIFPEWGPMCAMFMLALLTLPPFRHRADRKATP